MAKREDIEIGSYLHVYNRGAKKMPIFRQKSDLWRLMFGLFYLNHDGRTPDHWMHELDKFGGPQRFAWPESWGVRKPVVSILGFCITSNHFHLILKEIVEGGISRFMHRWAMGHSKFINQKYGESGSLFQGRYQARVVTRNEYLEYLPVYVMVKNTFELYPGGLREAINNFDAAYDWASSYDFGSLGTYTGVRSSPIVEKDIFKELFKNPEQFKEFSREAMLYKKEALNQYEFL